MDYLWIIVWACAAVALVGLEFATVSLVSIWFAVGAFAAFLTAIFVDAVWVQLLVFAGVSTLMLLCTRPFIKRFVEVKKTPTNINSIVGMTCTVLSEVGPDDVVGRVKKDDVYWQAYSFDRKDSFSPGEQAIIAAIEGNKLCLAKKIP